METGSEYVIDVFGCPEPRLREPRWAQALLAEWISMLDLKVVGSPSWHMFPVPGGFTGMAMLSESHWTIHTFPELGYAAINLYMCRSRETSDLTPSLKKHLDVHSVNIRKLERGNLI